MDGEPAVLAVRDALAKYHGGIVVQEGPAVSESPSNGLVEEAGKTVKGDCAGTEIADRGKDEREAEVRRRKRREDKTRTRDGKATSSRKFREPQRGQTPIGGNW